DQQRILRRWSRSAITLHAGKGFIGVAVEVSVLDVEDVQVDEDVEVE
ncbi:4717_t:CDS:2, partial [Acaulospora colombiana]